MADVKTLHETAARVLGAKAGKVLLALDEVTVECAAADYLDVMRTLRDHDELHFELLVDLCGVDYSDYKNEPRKESPLTKRIVRTRHSASSFQARSPNVRRRIHKTR